MTNADWPAPAEVLNEKGASEFVLVCEHASRHIPRDYDGLGLGEADLSRHIAWDVGAADVARRLSAMLDAPAFLATYSRLLIDLNRPTGSPSSIVERSEATDIPGNLAIGGDERARRIEHMFKPFHDRVAGHLDARARARQRTRLVTIHSFVPVFLGQSRPWHAGILFGRAAEFASQVLAGIKRDPGLVLDFNVPYRVTAENDYAIPIHGDARGIPAVEIEIRHDLIAHEVGAREWTGRLAGALEDA
jgi:predicted N-formylglutamate amidohydrolase